MDALALDQMLPEYQEKRKDAEIELAAFHEDPALESHTLSEVENQPSESSYEQDYGAGSTVPISEEISTNIADSSSASRASNEGPSSRSSTTSSTSSSSNLGGLSSVGSSSIYQPGFLAPTINYERENLSQKLVAVVGREFDQPSDIASHLQKLVPKQGQSDIPVIKFVPFTLKRKVLLKGNFDSKELIRHDLICMCYNASEARILLTGTDGFYTSLLKHVEALIGTNKAAFLITNYNQPYSHATSDSPTAHPNTASLLSPTLHTRLYHQESLRAYLDSSQVFSWSDKPNKLQTERLIELANMERNPQGLFANPSCVVL